MKYNTEPVYVLQLVDYSGEVSYYAVLSSQSSSFYKKPQRLTQFKVIRRLESAIPVNRQAEIPKTKTVLELVTSISSTGIRRLVFWSLLLLYWIYGMSGRTCLAYKAIYCSSACSMTDRAA